VLNNLKVATGSDDRTVKLWEQFTCIQTLAHPQSVWTIATNIHDDIITGCEDYSIRVFTNNPN